MIYECTDCYNCADFACGYRVICLHDELDPAEVCEYFPVGEVSAEACVHFEEGFPVCYSWKDFTAAEEYSKEVYGEITYQGIKAWCVWEQKKNLDVSKNVHRKE